jgi:hypothetical protein
MPNLLIYSYLNNDLQFLWHSIPLNEHDLEILHGSESNFSLLNNSENKIHGTFVIFVISLVRFIRRSVLRP